MNRTVHPLIADLLDKIPTSGDGVETGIEEYPGRPTVYGDRAYGGGEFQQLLTDHSINSGCRSAAPTAPKGRYTKDRLKIDLQAGAVTCPRGVTVTISTHQDGTGVARFGRACTNCELRNKWRLRENVGFGCASARCGVMMLLYCANRLLGEPVLVSGSELVVVVSA